MGRDETAGQACRRGNRDLLPEHGPDGEFETVPGAGNAQARAGGDQGRERRVLCQMRRDGHRVGGEVEHPAHPGNDGRQGRELGEAHRHPQRVAVGGGAHCHDPRRPAKPQGPGIFLRRHPLDPGNGTAAQEGQDRGPVIGRLVAQQQLDLAPPRGRHVASLGPPQRARRPAEQRLEGLVEPPHAAKSCREGDLGHRQGRFVDELLGEQDPAGLGDGDRRGAEVLVKEAPQLALADAQAFGQIIDARLVERAKLDQGERAGDGVGGATPGAEIGSGFRAAAQAGAEPCLLGGGGGGIEGHVLALAACAPDRSAGNRCRWS